MMGPWWLTPFMVGLGIGLTPITILMIGFFYEAGKPYR